MMSVNMRDGELIPQNTPTDTDAYGETVASQEEISLEKTEEKLRAILIPEDPSTYVHQETVCVDCCFVADSLDEKLDQAAKELITGDSDDPPFSEEAVEEILRITSNARRLDAEEKEASSSRLLTEGIYESSAQVCNRGSSRHPRHTKVSSKDYISTAHPPR